MFVEIVYKNKIIERIMCSSIIAIETRPEAKGDETVLNILTVGSNKAISISRNEVESANLCLHDHPRSWPINLFEENGQ